MSRNGPKIGQKVKKQPKYDEKCHFKMALNGPKKIVQSVYGYKNDRFYQAIFLGSKNF